MKLKVLVSIITILVLVITGAVYFYFKEKAAIKNISSFAECKENGFPIQESFPARCSTPDGRTFTEEASVDSQDSHTNLIQVLLPKPNDTIKSPVTITGRARGYWYFEASFPVEILDAEGKIIGQGPAQANGNWMTEDFVPFTLSLGYTSSTTQSGTIVLRKDNPSGLPENDDSISIPVTLQPN
ncbi:MAG TPA: Gmad2 immunoglobulin-like domain-containing protein [Candidatus Nanoarchaeia archaeon]|nr:Gmad2 immunoglobulin-like domain-containing protein [Candidatus Nanoarchaeia archaeon]